MSSLLFENLSEGHEFLIYISSHCFASSKKVQNCVAVTDLIANLVIWTDSSLQSRQFSLILGHPPPSFEGHFELLSWDSQLVCFLEGGRHLS